MHEYSDDPDVVARLAAEFAWAIKAHRRYVELRPDDAVALWARVEELTTALTGFSDRPCEALAIIGRTCEQRGPHAVACGVCNARAVLATKSP